MRGLAEILIAGYQFFVSPLLAQALGWGGCRFVPTCSGYGRTAIRQYGLRVGFVFLVKRLGRCHPWSAGGYDALPLPRRMGRRAHARSIITSP